METNAITLENQQYVNAPIKAAMHGKCPQCRRGEMFATGLSSLFAQKMNEKCAHCHFHYEIEPGYFYVAMFVSYAMNVAIIVTFAIGTYILTHSWNPWLYCGVTLGPAIFFYRSLFVIPESSFFTGLLQVYISNLIGQKMIITLLMINNFQSRALQ